MEKIYPKSFVESATLGENGQRLKNPTETTALARVEPVQIFSQKLIHTKKRIRPNVTFSVSDIAQQIYANMTIAELQGQLRTLRLQHGLKSGRMHDTVYAKTRAAIKEELAKRGL